MFKKTSTASVVMSLSSFFILLVSSLFFFFRSALPEDLPILLVFLENQFWFVYSFISLVSVVINFCSYNYDLYTSSFCGFSILLWFIFLIP